MDERHVALATVVTRTQRGNLDACVVFSVYRPVRFLVDRARALSPETALEEECRCLEAEDLVLELGNGSRSGISNLLEMAPMSFQRAFSRCGTKATDFIAEIIGGGPHMSTLCPTPCSGDPTPPAGMCSSIICLVTNPSLPVQPAGGLFKTCFRDTLLVMLPLPPPELSGRRLT